MNLRRLLFACLVVTTLVSPGNARAQMPPKAKAFMMVTAYGAGGGAILGLASMAFGTSSRAIAQGASLGLYAGILFGTYILVSHHNRRQGQYDDRSSPYREGEGDEYEDYSDDPGAAEGDAGRFDSSVRGLAPNGLHASVNAYRVFETKKGGQLPPLQMTLVSWNF
jgi:hypothetical protein